MKVYVCYSDYSCFCEGCTEPEHVYTKESDAIKWVAEFPNSERTYKGMDLQ